MMPDRDQLRADVRQALSDPFHLCEVLGLLAGKHKRQASGVSVLCPLHAEDDPSCSVTRGDGGGGCRVVCHAGCDFGGKKGNGDELSLVAAVLGLDIAHDFPAVLSAAAGFAGVDTSKTLPHRPALRALPRETPAVPDLTAEWDALPPVDEETWEYLRSRGLGDAADLCRTPSPCDFYGSKEDFDALPPGEKLRAVSARGYRLALEMRDGAGRVVGIQLRRLAPRPGAGERDDRFLVVGQSGAGVFGAAAAVKAAKVVVLCEGLTDTLGAVLSMRGAPQTAVVGIPGVKAVAGFVALPIAGKRVLTPLDADTAGDAAAAKLAEEIRRAKATPIRARPPEGMDLCEMRNRGVDLRDFFRYHLTGFRSMASDVNGERVGRVAMRGHCLTTGIRFLDLAIGGIFPDDLLLIGAPSGTGKTETATGIARLNAKTGKHVHVIALEAARYEITRRTKFPLISRMVYQDRANNGDLWKRLNYLEWYTGVFDVELDRYERIADEMIRRDYPTLFVRYKGADRFDAATLEESILSVADETDLIAIDHLQYIDTDNANENRGTKEIVQCIRNTQNRVHLRRGRSIPIVLVVQIRKADRVRKKSQLVPSLDDIHGSSDAAKIATKAVMLASCSEDGTEPHLYPTYIDISKCRPEGSRTRYCGLVEWSRRTSLYEDRFELGRLSEDRSAFRRVKEEDLPRWSTPARPPAEQGELPLPDAAPPSEPPPPYWPSDQHWPGGIHPNHPEAKE